MSENYLNPRHSTEKSTRVMFETFNVRGFYCEVPCVLALYSSGRTTGISLDCGHGVTSCVPTYEGYMLPHASRRLDCAGQHVTQSLFELISVKNPELELGDNARLIVCHDHLPVQCTTMGSFMNRSPMSRRKWDTCP